MGWINDFALTQQEQKQTEPKVPDRLGVTLEVSSGLNANQAARVSRLAGEIGATDDLVLASPGDAEQVAIANKIRTYPSLTDWAGRSAVNAAMAREEPDALGVIFEGIKGTATAPLAFVPKAAGFTNKFLWDTLGYGAGAVESGADFVGLDSIEGAFRWLRKKSQAGSRDTSTFINNPLWNAREGLEWYHPERLAHDTVGGLASMVPAVAAMVGTGGASAAPTVAAAGRTIFSSLAPRVGFGGIVGGAQEGTALYTDLSSEPGGDDRNVANLLAGANMTWGSSFLNTISFGKILGTLPPGFRKKLADVIQTGVTEGVTEQLENPLGAWLAGLARGDDAKKIMEDVWEATTDLSVMPGAMLPGGGLRVGHIYLEGRQSQNFVDQQLAVNAKVTASQLYQRSPEKMRELLDSAGEVMSQVVTIPRAQLSDEVLAALNVAGELERTISVPLSELHARLTPEAFKEVIPLAEPVEGQSLVTVRRKMKQALAASIGQAVEVRDAERAINSTIGLEESRQATEDLRTRVQAETDALRSIPAEESAAEGSTAQVEGEPSEPSDRGVAHADAQVLTRQLNVSTL